MDDVNGEGISKRNQELHQILGDTGTEKNIFEYVTKQGLQVDTESFPLC